MLVHLAYGQHGLDLELPDDVLVVEPRYVPGIDETNAILQALRQPIDSPALRNLVRPGDRVVVVHSDLTRPMPNARVLPVLLAELEAAGVRRDDITLLNALGTHRRQTEPELIGMLGAEVVANYHCLQHDCRDDASLVALGRTRFGHPVRINRTYMESDVRILTGFIEPHLFAGFSGGPKGVLPSVVGAESVLTNHGVRMIADPNARWGVCEGNPIWEEMLEVALITHPTFLLNVTLNRMRQITGVFAGDLRAAHAAGREFCRQSAMVPVPHYFDIVLTTNSGYPLDMNLYQAVKGMSAAAQVVRPGGTIIVAAECREGIPEHGDYATLLRTIPGPQAYMQRLAKPGFSSMDQWEAQLQAMIQERADVWLYASGLSDEQIRAAWLKPCRDIAGLLASLASTAVRPQRICVLPDGPQTIPYVPE